MTEHIRLDLPVLLPEIPDEADRCVERLLAELRERDGVSEAHVVGATMSEPTKLCIHYDPDKVSLARIRKAARAAGATLTAQFGHLVWQVEGIEQQRRARTVTEVLGRLEGVFEAQATASGALRVEFERSVIDEAQIEAALRPLGVRRRDLQDTDKSAASAPSDPALPAHPEGDDHQGHDHGEDGGHAHGGIFGANTELFFALLSGGCLAVGFALSWIEAAPPLVSTGLYLAAYFFGGFFTLREAIDSLKLRRFEIDTLMLVAAAGAAALGEFAEGALLLFLFSLGHALEHYAMGRAKRAIEALAELAPQTAVVRRGDNT